MRRKQVLHILGGLFSVVLFAGAAFVLHREAGKYGLQRIAAELRSFSETRLLIAGALTLFCYWTLTAYDWLAFRYVRQAISYRRVTFAALLAYTFSVNIGMANLAGAAVRLRIYSAWGIRPRTVAQVVGLDVLSNWLGFLLVTGTVFVVEAPPLPRLAHLPFETARPIGVLFLALEGAYFALLRWYERPLRIRGTRIRLPRGRIFLAQIAIGAVDFLIGGLALFALLPSRPPLSYAEFLGAYLLAQAVAILSHVPGGLGVFETILLMTLGARFGGARVLASLIVYRVIYFLIPLVLAAPVYAVFEARNFSRRST